MTTKKKVYSKKNEDLAKKILLKNSEKKSSTKNTKQNKEINLESITIKTKPVKNTKNPTFKIGSYAVYPSHGVGKITEIQTTKILNQDLSCYLIYFEKEKLTIKVPVKSVGKVGLRPLVSKKQMDEVFITLRSGIKKLKGMWSRRAQEYETKINSGDIMLLAEVIRDLTRDIDDSERSYSERIIYETAIYRLSSEYSAIYNVSHDKAKDHVLTIAKDKINSEESNSANDDFGFAFNDKDEEDEYEDDEDEEYEDEDDDEYGEEKSARG